MLIKIFYHFKHSSKGWEGFFDVLKEFDNIRALRVLKHCTTRWLSLLHCLDHLLEQWPAHYAYFDHQDEIEPSNSRVQRVATSLRSVEAKLVCTFVASVLRPMNKFNTVFQTNASRIATMQQQMLSLLRGYLANFIQAELITCAEDLTKKDFRDRVHQVSDEELSIGTATRLLLAAASIAAKELLLIIVAAAIWGPSWGGRCSGGVSL